MNFVMMKSVWLMLQFINVQSSVLQVRIAVLPIYIWIPCYRFIRTTGRFVHFLCMVLYMIIVDKVAHTLINAMKFYSFFWSSVLFAFALMTIYDYELVQL